MTTAPDLTKPAAIAATDPTRAAAAPRIKLQSHGYAIDHPDQAIKDVKQVFPDTNEKLATQELAAIGPLFCSGGAKYIGKAEPALWTTSQDLLAEVKLLPAGQDPKSYYTLDYLPPESQMRACKQ